MKTTTRSLFDGVPEAEKAKLDVKYITVPRGTVIYSYGKKAKNACWIIDGSARTLRTDKNGFVSVIEFLGAKSLFGDYFDGDFVKGDFVEIVATTKCKIAIIDFEKVEKSDFHTTIYYDKNLNIWFIKDGYKDEESSTGSWIFSTNPIFIISGMTIRMWNKEIKLFYE